MYQKKNKLSRIIRANQVYHNVTELTVFDTTESGNYKVCFSGQLDDFNAIGKLDINMQLYRQNLLQRCVDQKLIFHEKLFVWLRPESDGQSIGINNKDQLRNRLISCRKEYQSAEENEDAIIDSLKEIGVDVDKTFVDKDTSFSLSEAISQYLYSTKEDNYGELLEAIMSAI